MADEVTVAVVESQAPTQSSSSDPKVVDAVQTHLDAFNDLEEVAETPVVETPVTEEKPVEEKPTEEKPVEEKAAEEKPVEEKPKEEAVSAKAEPTLPAAYVRTAKARGWTDEEISDAVKVNADAAMRTFERMHTSRTQEINDWANLGRKQRQNSSVGASVSPAPIQTVQSPAPTLQPIDIKAMVEKFGNEELVTALAGPVNAAIQMLGPIVEQAKLSQESARRTQQEVLGKTVEDFFTHKDMTPFATAYGQVGSLTTPQIETRSKVLETADALIAGAAFQGRQLSVQDALMLAHDSVTSGMKETIIRDQIRSKVTKRAAGITLKPTAVGRRAVNAPPKDRQELLNRTAANLSEIFG